MGVAQYFLIILIHGEIAIVKNIIIASQQSILLFPILVCLLELRIIKLWRLVLNQP